MTAEEATQQAAEEGFALDQIETAGRFKGVKFYTKGHQARPYQAHVSEGGKMLTLGYYATAEEAALVFARYKWKRQGGAALPPPLAAAEAAAQAEAEGLTLTSSSSSQTGFRNVAFDPRNRARPYEVRVWRDSKQVRLGNFARVRVTCTAQRGTTS